MDDKTRLLSQLSKIRDLVSKSASKLEELEDRVDKVREEVTVMKKELAEGWQRSESDTM